MLKLIIKLLVAAAMLVLPGAIPAAIIYKVISCHIKRKHGVVAKPRPTD